MKLDRIVTPVMESDYSRFEDDTNRTIGWLQSYLRYVSQQPSHPALDDAKTQVQLAIDSLERVSQLLNKEQ